MSVVVCFIAIRTSLEYQITNEAETTSKPARCVYKVPEEEVYELTSLANTNGKPRCAYIMLTLLSFFSLFTTAMRHLTLHQFLIEHVHETECKVRNVVNVTLGLSPGIPGDNFSSGIFDPKSL